MNYNRGEVKKMADSRAIPQGYMTVGEVAKKMGVTVRALQYYDREGLFRPSAVSEGGRRLYTDKDIIRLHQILSLKSLGFSIDEIKNRLTAIDTPEEVAAALTEQGEAIQAQIDALTQSLHDIQTLKAEVLQMQSVDFKKYADIIVNLQLKNDDYWLIKYFDDDTLDDLRVRFDKESGLAFIRKFKALREKAVQYGDAGVAPESAQGQAFAKEFWQLITEFTGGDMRMLPQLMKMGAISTNRSDWQQKQEKLNAFLEPALEVYFQNLGINPFEVNHG